MKKLKLWLHRHGYHFYTKPVELVEETDWYIEGKGTVEYQEQVSLYRKMRCEYCNRRHLKHLRTVVTTSGRGGLV